MIVSADMQISTGTTFSESEKENFDTRMKPCHDQKFGVNENNVAYADEKDTPITLPLDDLSLVESDLDLNMSSEHEQDSDAKGRADSEVGPIRILDENDSTQHENSITTITPIPAEHAIDSPAVGPAPDIERGTVVSSATNNGSNESQTRVDNSYTVTWSVVARRGEKMCGTTLPRFFWLAVLLGLLAVLCASVGYLMHSLRLLE